MRGSRVFQIAAAVVGAAATWATATECDECNACSADPAFVVSDGRDVAGLRAARRRGYVARDETAVRLVAARASAFFQCETEILALWERVLKRTPADRDARTLKAWRSYRLLPGRIGGEWEPRVLLRYFTLQDLLGRFAAESSDGAVRVAAAALECRLAAAFDDGPRVARAAGRLVELARSDERAADRLVDLARALRHLRSGLARQLLRKAIAVDGRGERAAEALRLHGALAYEAGDHVAAQRSFEQFLARFPGSVHRFDVRYRLVRIIMSRVRQAQHYGRVVPHLELIAAEAPTAEERARALYVIGDIRRIQRRTREAADGYAAVVRNYPDSSYAPSARELYARLARETD